MYCQSRLQVLLLKLHRELIKKSVKIGFSLNSSKIIYHLKYVLGKARTLRSFTAIFNQKNCKCPGLNFRPNFTFFCNDFTD